MTQSSPAHDTSAHTAARQRAMAAFAAADPTHLAAAKACLPALPAFDLVRPPETGLVMVRGKAGGSGQPFNLGEVTVTRCVVRLKTGETGSAYCLGRHKQKAADAALFDALWQSPDFRTRIEEEVIAPLEQKQAEADARLKAETAATKVDFFTMVRGDN
ncbi:phosphonate C-P lyase system protein PhnG [Roseibium sp. RKSG952]|uniref:phosphonate C-P lyase system protein PhnG n=1 Tax=Roseibium sp. RKSG952 TaxID=2529384 RepID=UPI0012BD43FE|nr:phosphonate C-P lyase system protein PhnG [Roseibium sp. RKSG952]MTH98184.1 phosphonate C-P lyase system protein PhnG [Roseibium sp. RKSG952]